MFKIELYYIVSLHQTTTHVKELNFLLKLYYIVSLHQTTTLFCLSNLDKGCIISFLYIKPQRQANNGNS